MTNFEKLRSELTEEKLIQLILLEPVWECEKCPAHDDCPSIPNACPEALRWWMCMEARDDE